MKALKLEMKILKGTRSHDTSRTAPPQKSCYFRDIDNLITLNVYLPAIKAIVETTKTHRF